MAKAEAAARAAPSYGRRRQRSDLERSDRGMNMKRPYLNTRCVADRYANKACERIAEFDQHVERHEQAKDVFAPGIVDESLDGNQRPARRQC